MLTGIQTVIQKLVSGGGLNTSSDPFELQENESPDCMEVFFNEDGTLSKRYGREILNLAVTGATDYCNGLFDYGVSPGIRKLIGSFGTTLYKMDDLDGTWDSLETGRADSLHYFERSGTNLIITDDARSVLKYWDGSAAAPLAVNASAPLAKIAKSFQGYLLLANTSANGRRIYYEDESTILTGDYADYFTIPSSSDDEIGALVEYNGRLYASLRNDWYRISFVGGSSVFDYKKVSSVVGAVPRTIQVVSLPRIGEVIIYLGWNKKVYVFDENSSYPISAKYENDNSQSQTFLNNINQGGMLNAHATVDTNRNLYRLYLPIGGDGTITHCFNISLESLSCSVTANQKFVSSCMAEDSNKKRWHICGGYNGDSYRMDRTYIDEVPINNFGLGADGAVVETIGTTDAASTINEAGGFAEGVHDAGDHDDYVEDATYNYSNLGVVANDRVVNKTDGINSKVIASLANGAGTNARLNATAIMGDDDDIFTVYKSIMLTTNHSIYIGSKLPFDAVEVDLLQGANATVTPSIKYSSDAVGGYTAVSGSTDGTAGFTKSGTIVYTLPTGWTLTNVDDNNTAFTDTTTYYYLKIQRTTAVTTFPCIVRIRIGTRIDDYYISPGIYGEAISNLKKGQRILYYFNPTSNAKLRFYDKRDAERAWLQRDNIPMYNAHDDFIGENWLLNSNNIGSQRHYVEWGIDVSQVNNMYQYKLDSNKSIRMPWKLNRVEISGKVMGIGSSNNKIR